MKLVSIFTLSSLLFLPISFSQENSSQILSNTYQIGVNDVLEISVYDELDLTQEVRVTTNGFISYPLLGRIKVTGMTINGLEDYVRTSLAKDYIRNPQVKVFVKEFSNVFVYGQVKKPGPVPFNGGMTVVQAITTAGGFSDIANKRKVRIIRSGDDEKKKMIKVNISSITKGNGEDKLLQPGDTVVVPESFF